MGGELTARKPPELLRKAGRPRKDDFTRDPTPSAPGGRPLPVAPEGHDPEIFKWAGQRVPLVYIARGRRIPIEELQDGGRYWDTVCLGILAYAAHAADSIYLKACSLSGNPIPGIHWGKCNLKMRETGENETEVKKPRKIGRVTMRGRPALRGIKGGSDGGSAGGVDRGRGSGDGDSGMHAPDGGVDSPDAGDSRG